jgi:hypothetical protein
MRAFLTFFCAILTAIPTYAQDAASSHQEDAAVSNANADAEIQLPHFWDFLTNLPKDLKTFGEESLTPDGLVLIGGITAMTAVQVAGDFEIWQAAKIPTGENKTIGKLTNMGVSMGDGFFQFGIVGGFLAAGAASGDRKMVRTASQLTESILATGIVVQVMKHIIGRESPFSADTRTGVWRTFPNQVEYMKDFQKYDAVPSGHLSTATTTLIVIQENYPDQKWIPWVGWPVLGGIAFSLAGTSIHWWSDYPIAIGLGYSFAKIITGRNNSKPGDKRAAWRPLVMPTLSGEGEPIVMAAWSF